nr:MAG TPA: hypothetical protein [Caudoviricetes sp.]
MYCTVTHVMNTIISSASNLLVPFVYNVVIPL